MRHRLPRTVGCSRALQKQEEYEIRWAVRFHEDHPHCCRCTWHHAYVHMYVGTQECCRRYMTYLVFVFKGTSVARSSISSRAKPIYYVDCGRVTIFSRSQARARERRLELGGRRKPRDAHRSGVHELERAGDAHARQNGKAGAKTRVLSV